MDDWQEQTRKLKEEINLLKNKNGYLESILSLSPGHIFWKNLEGVYLGCNDLQARSVGLSSPDEINGKTDFDLPWSENAEMLRKIDIEVMQSGRAIIVEEPIKNKNGSSSIFLSSKQPLYSEGKIIGIIGISFDITEKKKLEEELKETKKQLEIANKVNETKEFYENIIALAPGHIYWKDRTGKFLGCNDLQAKNAGLSSRHEIVGKTNYEMPWKEQAHILDKIDFEIMETGIAQTVEEPATLADGTTGIFLSKKEPIYDKNEIIGIIGISIDITAQHQNKALKKENEIVKEKIKAQKNIGAKMAHELRTPLASISLAMKLLKNIFPALLHSYNIALEHNLLAEKLEETTLERVPNILDNGINDVEFAFSVINTMLADVNLQETNLPEHRKFSIKDCVDEVLERYPYEEKERALVTWNNMQDFDFLGNKVVVRQILNNLLKNSFYFIKKAKKGEITIWAEIKGDCNYLHFKDTAQGIPKSYQSEIFKAFFYTESNGNGLGLAFCKESMSKMNGDITCISEEGQFAEFILQFPKINVVSEKH